MSDAPDFEFDLGGGRHLKGRGWRGLVALALLLTTILLAISIASPGLGSLFRSLPTAIKGEILHETYVTATPLISQAT
jgi:hypothetical protein